MASLQAYLMDIYKSVDTSKRLEKIAAYFSDDEEVKLAALRAKIAVDDEIFDLVKHATLKSELGRKLLAGLAYSAAPLAGTAIVGHSLLSKAKRDAAETAADVRNKVLQTGLGLAVIGGGLYGLHRLADRGQQTKTSEDTNTALQDLVAKLATVGKIEEDFDNLDFDSLSPEAKKLACELRMTNRKYGIQLLYEASH